MFMYRIREWLVGWIILTLSRFCTFSPLLTVLYIQELTFELSNSSLEVKPSLTPQIILVQPPEEEEEEEQECPGDNHHHHHHHHHHPPPSVTPLPPVPVVVVAGRGSSSSGSPQPSLTSSTDQTVQIREEFITFREKIFLGISESTSGTKATAKQTSTTYLTDILVNPCSCFSFRHIFNKHKYQ